MNSESSDHEQNAGENSPKIHQNSSGNLGGGQQAIDGDGNIQIQDNRKFEVNIYPDSNPGVELPESLSFNSGIDLVTNYLKTLLFLFAILLAWSFMGLFAHQALPQSLAKSLIQYTFNGFWIGVKSPKSYVKDIPKRLWEGIRRSDMRLRSVFDKAPNTGDIDEAQYLNKLDSQYWLLSHLIEFLGNKSRESEITNWRVRELEEDRIFILEKLEPLKRKYYKKLAFFQNFINSLGFRNRQQGKVDKILNKLIIKYTVIEDASDVEVQELLERLEAQISTVSSSRTLYKVWRLLTWASSVRNVQNTSISMQENMKYSKFSVRSIRTSQIYHVLGCCDRFPKVEKSGDEGRIEFFGSPEEAESKGLKICRNCQRKLRLRGMSHSDTAESNPFGWDDSWELFN